MDDIIFDTDQLLTNNDSSETVKLFNHSSNALSTFMLIGGLLNFFALHNSNPLIGSKKYQITNDTNVPVIADFFYVQKTPMQRLVLTNIEVNLSQSCNAIDWSISEKILHVQNHCHLFLHNITMIYKVICLNRKSVELVKKVHQSLDTNIETVEECKKTIDLMKNFKPNNFTQFSTRKDLHASLINWDNDVQRVNRTLQNSFTLFIKSIPDFQESITEYFAGFVAGIFYFFTEKLSTPEFSTAEKNYHLIKLEQKNQHNESEIDMVPRPFIFQFGNGSSHTFKKATAKIIEEFYTNSVTKFALWVVCEISVDQSHLYFTNENITLNRDLGVVWSKFLKTDDVILDTEYSMRQMSSTMKSSKFKKPQDLYAYLIGEAVALENIDNKLDKHIKLINNYNISMLTLKFQLDKKALHVYAMSENDYDEYVNDNKSCSTSTNQKSGLLIIYSKTNLTNLKMYVDKNSICKLQLILENVVYDKMGTMYDMNLINDISNHLNTLLIIDINEVLMPFIWQLPPVHYSFLKSMLGLLKKSHIDISRYVETSDQSLVFTDNDYSKIIFIDCLILNSQKDIADYERVIHLQKLFYFSRTIPIKELSTRPRIYWAFILIKNEKYVRAIYFFQNHKTKSWSHKSEWGFCNGNHNKAKFMKVFEEISKRNTTKTIQEAFFKVEQSRLMKNINTLDSLITEELCAVTLKNINEETVFIVSPVDKIIRYMFNLEKANKPLQMLNLIKIVRTFSVYYAGPGLLGVIAALSSFPIKTTDHSLRYYEKNLGTIKNALRGHIANDDIPNLEGAHRVIRYIPLHCGQPSQDRSDLQLFILNCIMTLIIRKNFSKDPSNNKNVSMNDSDNLECAASKYFKRFDKVFVTHVTSVKNKYILMDQSILIDNSKLMNPTSINYNIEPNVNIFVIPFLNSSTQARIIATKSNEVNVMNLMNLHVDESFTNFTIQVAQKITSLNWIDKISSNNILSFNNIQYILDRMNVSDFINLECGSVKHVTAHSILPYVDVITINGDMDCYESQISFDLHGPKTLINRATSGYFNYQVHCTEGQTFLDFRKGGKTNTIVFMFDLTGSRSITFNVETIDENSFEISLIVRDGASKQVIIIIDDFSNQLILKFRSLFITISNKIAHFTGFSYTPELPKIRQKFRNCFFIIEEQEINLSNKYRRVKIIDFAVPKPYGMIFVHPIRYTLELYLPNCESLILIQNHSYHSKSINETMLTIIPHKLSEYKTVIQLTDFIERLESKNVLVNLKITINSTKVRASIGTDSIGYFNINIDLKNRSSADFIIINRYVMKLAIDIPNQSAMLMPVPIYVPGAAKILILDETYLANNTVIHYNRKFHFTGQKTFYVKLGTELIVTNMFNDGLEEEQLCSVVLTNFFQELFHVYKTLALVFENVVIDLTKVYPDLTHK